MLPDYLHPGLSLVICGMAAGPRSARIGHYYAGRGNAFWPVLHATGLTARLLAPEEDALITGFGIGLTDVAKGVSGMDRDLPPGLHRRFDAGAFRARIAPVAPLILAFNGKGAARIALADPRPCYGPQHHGWLWPAGGRTEIWVLPSTSGAARASWDPAVWSALAARLGRLQRGEDASVP